MTDIQDALETIFSADSSAYQRRGFQRRIGFRTRPALIHIDLANAWTRPGNAFSCEGMDTIIPGVQRLNDVNPSSPARSIASRVCSGTCRMR